jgi:hypothetical protein
MFFRAAFEDGSLVPGEVPELIAESKCSYDDKDFTRFKDELKFTCCYHEAGFILKEKNNSFADILVESTILPPIIYSKYFQNMQACKIPKIDKNHVIDKVKINWRN